MSIQNLKTLSAAAILAFAVASPAMADDNEVLIGAATSFSGWMAAFDTSPTRSAEIAIDDINAAGGVLGKKLLLSHIYIKTDDAQQTPAAKDSRQQSVK